MLKQAAVERCRINSQRKVRKVGLCRFAESKGGKIAEGFHDQIEELETFQGSSNKIEGAGSLNTSYFLYLFASI